MKRIAFVISLLSLLCTQARAQQGCFVFIQSAKQSPFYVRVNENTFSSSAIGYLVIPALEDGTYQVAIGFPRNQYPEQQFKLTVAGKDLGYQLQNTGASWILLNEQTQQTLDPKQEVTHTVMLGERKSGQFAALMSSLVNDSTVMYKSLVRTDPPIKELQPIAKNDTAINLLPVTEVNNSALAAQTVTTPAKDSVMQIDSTANAGVAGTAISTDSAVTISTGTATFPQLNVGNTGTSKKHGIIQLHERSGQTARGYLYIDTTGPVVDTIDVAIAYEKTVIPDTALFQATDTAKVRVDEVAEIINLDKPDSTAGKLKKDSALLTVTTQPTSGSAEDAAKLVTNSQPASTVTERPATRQNTETALPVAQTANPDSAGTNTKKQLVLMNSDCVNFASELDVDKLRVKLYNAKTDEEKLVIAKKAFRVKCYATKDIRALSELFPGNESRFNFFDTAYPFVSDTGNFKQLIDLLSDELYIARFKTLVRIK